MRRASERLALIIESVRQEVANARAAWPFAPEAEEAYFHDSYPGEIIEMAKVEGLQIQQRDDGLVVFPSILRVLPAERAVRIDRKKTQAVRPSRLIRTLKAVQTRKPRFTPEQFIEVLHRAYRLLVGNDYGATAALASIYQAFTLLPGSASNYDQTDFARDLFLVDRSGLTHTKSGAKVSLPASTGTKESKGTYSFIAPDGETITYYGIRFTEEAE
ncbi:MAG: hypothetical protein ACRD1O_09645 [Terriglobia bacterium]